MKLKNALIIFIALLTVPFDCFAADTDFKTTETANYVRTAAMSPAPGSVGGEWAVIGVKRSGITADAYFDGYLRRLGDFMKENGGSINRYTDYSRIVLALRELDQNDTYGLGAYVNDYDKVTNQGINGPIFALEAKHALGDQDTVTRDRYIEYILSRQSADGSFALSEGTPDTDITAMAVAALSLYNTNIEIDRAINRGFLYLSSVQAGDGSFAPTKGGEASCESTAQVIIAMKRHGLRPDNRFFVKNDKTPSDGLELFRKSGGGYAHLASDSAPDQMASEQALLALTAPEGTPKTLIYDSIWFDASQAYLESQR